MQYKSIVLALACLLLLLITGACSVMPQAEPVTGSEYDELLAAGDPIAQGIFQAIDAQDYPTFSKDFDDTMKKALDEAAFSEMSSTFAEKIGQYTGGEVTQIERIENLVVLTYALHYTQEDTVSARVSLREGSPPQVAGLWFDSPKLRQ